jgi:integrase/recombinase XerC/integrase/recombinase XerD
VRLHIGDFSSAAGTIHARGKGNKDRVVVLPAAALEPLMQYLQTRPGAGSEDPLFLTAYGAGITARAVIRVVQRAAKRLGRHLHPCMLRHSYATELLERRADIRDIRDLLGYESVATTEIYTHVSAARRRRVVRPARWAFEGRGFYAPEGKIGSVSSN